MATVWYASLDGLPAELVVEIGRYLSVEDISSARKAGSIRLANRFLYSYPRIGLSVLLAAVNSLELGMQLLQNPVFAARTKLLYIDMGQFSPQPISSEGEYSKQLFSPCHAQAYATLLEAQRVLCRERQDVKLLSQILRILREANSSGVDIELIFHDEHIPYCPEQLECPGADHDNTTCCGLNRPLCACSVNSRPCGYRQIARLIGQPMNQMSATYSTWEGGMKDPFTVLLQSLAETGFRSRSITAVEHMQRVDLACFVIPPALLYAVAHCFTGLKVLKLRLKGDEDDVRFGNESHGPAQIMTAISPSHAVLAQLLKNAARTLEVLSITYCTSDAGRSSDTIMTRYTGVFNSCIRPTTFPRLRELWIEVCALYVQDLLEFTTRHSATLRKLDVTRCKLLDDMSVIENTDWKSDPSPREIRARATLSKLQKAIPLPLLEFTAESSGSHCWHPL